MDTPRCCPILRVERGRRSARDADAQQRSCLHLRCDRNRERARRRERRRRVVAQRGVRHQGGGPGLGLLELAPGGGRRRHRRRRRPARRLRPRHRQAALVRAGRRRELQLAATGDDRRSRAGPAVERSGRDQRRARRWQAALGARVAGLPHRAAGRDRGRRHPDHRQWTERHAPPRDRARPRRMDRRRALDLDRAEALLQRLRRSRRPCLRLRRPHPRVHRRRGRNAQVEGRTLRQRPARPVARPGPAAGAVGGG